MSRTFGIIILILVLGAAIGAVVYKNRQNPLLIDSNKLQVTASFYPLYFFAAQIGGDKAQVTNLTPYGAEPHDYEAKAQDIARIESSRLLVLNGGGLEPWAASVKQNLDPKRTLVVSAGAGLGGVTSADPHYWLSPPLATQMVEHIADAYVLVDPANSDYYRANASALTDKLAALDADFSAGLHKCASQDIVTSHAAFGYLASAYGLAQMPITGLSPDSEPSPNELAALAVFARQNKVKYIFFENLVSPRLAQTLAQEVGAQTLMLDPLEGLSAEALDQGQDYFSVMRQNLANLEIALQCAK